MKVIVDGKENRVSVDPGNGRGILNDEEFKLEISEDGPYMIRFGVFGDAWWEKEVSEPYRELYPLPGAVIDANPNLTQNPGY